MWKRSDILAKPSSKHRKFLATTVTATIAVSAANTFVPEEVIGRASAENLKFLDVR